jgi:hypothetical protein
MRAPCSIDGCDKESRGRGWCSMHWLRWKAHGDPLVVLRPGVDYQVKQPCSVDDCDTLTQAHGYCHKHLGRWRKNGDPLGRIHIAAHGGRS